MGQQVPENDRKLTTGYVTYKGVSGDVKTYVARPKKVAYSINMYPGTDHGFHNDTSEARYNKPAAQLAGNRTCSSSTRT